MRSLARRAGFALDLLRAQAGRAVPFKLTFVVTDECSCRCAICSLWQRPRRGPDLAEIDALFAANPQLSWINLSGGEVAERDDFAAIAAAAMRRTRVFALDFPTAGQQPGRVESGVRSALAAGVPRLFVSVSVDGPPEMHDRLRGTAGAFARAIETIDRLRAIRSRRLSVHAGVTFSSRNDADPDGLVDAILAAAPRLRREDLHFNVAHHAPHYYRNRAGDVPHGERIAAFLARERSRRSDRTPLAWLEAAYWRLAREWLVGGRAPLACSALAASAYVDPDLRLFPCATWDRPLADLRSAGYSLERAIASAGARAARADAAARRCPGCWTPCEAYPTLLTSPRAAARALLASPRPGELAPESIAR